MRLHPVPHRTSLAAWLRRLRLPSLALGLALSAGLAMASPDVDTAPDEPDDAFEAALAAEPPSAGLLSIDRDGRSAVSVWRSSLEAFAESDRINNPAPGGVVFVGSSSIRYWDGLARAFPALSILNRGFGGSQLADCTRHVDRLVLPYKPRLVVVYAGENDLAAGVSPEAVLGSYMLLVAQVHAALPATRVAFISIKPSPAREAQMAAGIRVNELVAAFTKRDARLDFIDVHQRMLDSAGRPRAELFRADALHMTPAGYALWNAAVEPYLLPRTADRTMARAH